MFENEQAEFDFMHENFRIKEGVGGLQVFMFVRFYVWSWCTAPM